MFLTNEKSRTISDHFALRSSSVLIIMGKVNVMGVFVQQDVKLLFDVKGFLDVDFLFTLLRQIKSL